MIPPLNLSASSSAKSGDATQGFSSTGGNFSVNYGNGVTQSQGDGGIPAMVWYAAMAIGAIYVWKRYS